MLTITVYGHRINLMECQNHDMQRYLLYALFAIYIPYRLIKSRWLVGTDDLFTVETIHSSRVSKFWIFFRNFGF